MFPVAKSLILVFSVITVAGCDRAFTEMPKATNLAGTYLLSKRSESFLLKRKGYAQIPAPEIGLGADYGIAILNLPDCATNGFGRPSGGFLGGEGRWELEKASLGWGLTVHIEKGGSLKAGWYTGPWMGIRGRSAPYRLELTIGDPDSGETLLYEKKAR